MRKSFKTVGVAALKVGALTLAACGRSGRPLSSGSKSSGGAGTGTLEVFSWWTSGSEAAALKVLETAFTTAAPDVTFKNAAVSGGGGSNARTVLATRLQGGNPPLHPGKGLASVVEDVKLQPRETCGCPRPTPPQP